ncbi:CHAT domain-containing protein, partial [Plectonema cf. radiosum LEGE 06105]
DIAENIELAIASYKAALQITTKEAFPQQWATTQNNLALAYSYRIKGDIAENIELAIASYKAALQITTKEAFPQQWATTQNNLALAYSYRIKGDIAENIELAIASYKAALQITTKEAFPYENALTLENLGILYQDEGRFNSAYNTYESAIAAVELLRGEIISGEESKRKQAEKWNRLYRNMVEVCLQLQDETQALEFIERSKTRNLVELLFNDELYPKGEIPAAVTQQLQQVRNEIAAEKQRLEQAEQNNLDINRNNLNQLRQQREDLISRIIGFKPIRFPEIQSLVDENTAIVEWYIFKDCFRAFIITRDCQKPIIWHSSQEDYQKLVDWSFDKYLQPYYQKKNLWRYELNDKLPQLAEILHLDQVISLIPQRCKKLILIPHRYLHLLPIHALQLSNGEYLIDKFSDGVSYAPSCQLLRVSQQQLSHCKDVGDVMYNVSTLFAIQNPTNDLEFTDIEVETIAAKFNPSHILKHSQATQSNLSQPSNADNLKNANWLHFSCHGYFNLNNPTKSGLQLADTSISPIPNHTESSGLLKLSDDTAIDLEKCLTLEKIFELTLSNCRLVSISACESGFTDYTSTSDEYIGLPSGFIRAGAASIVSSLWAVDDFSTAILMIKFYENIPNSNNMPIALNHAQKWLRQVTQNDLLEWIDENQNMTDDNKNKIKTRLEENYLPQQQPFKQPIFWGAFYVVGD